MLRRRWRIGARAPQASRLIDVAANSFSLQAIQSRGEFAWRWFLTGANTARKFSVEEYLRCHGAPGPATLFDA